MQMVNKVKTEPWEGADATLPSFRNACMSNDAVKFTASSVALSLSLSLSLSVPKKEEGG